MEIGHLEDLGIYRRIILKWLFKTSNGKAWTVQFWFRIGTGRERL
jgi:hypothetical protein